MIAENLWSLIGVCVGYALLCILFAGACLGSLVKEKSLAFRVCFYQAAANLYLIVWGYIFSFLHIHSVWAFWIAAFVLPLLAKIFLQREKAAEWAANMKNGMVNIQTGMWSGKYLLRRMRYGLQNAAKTVYSRYLRGRLFEILVWCVFIVYIVYLFGWFKLYRDGYACTDEETHLFWMKSFMQGNAFPTGMYPHGMHYLILAVTTMFGISLERGAHVFGILVTALVFLTFYLFLRSILKSRYAALIAVGTYLCTMTFGYDTYFRYSFSIPMELSLVAVFVMMLGLFDYLKTKSDVSLALFGMGVLWCAWVHSYGLIFGGVLCAVVGIVYFVPMRREKILRRIIVFGGLIPLGISIIPFAVGGLLGYYLEQSFGWGVAEMVYRPPGVDSSSISSMGVLLLLAALTVLCFAMAGFLAFRGEKEERKTEQARLYAFLGLSFSMISLFVLLYEKGIFALFSSRPQVFMALTSAFLVAVLGDCISMVCDRFVPANLGSEKCMMILCILYFVVRGCFFPIKTADDMRYAFVSQEAENRVALMLSEKLPQNTWTLVSTTFGAPIVTEHGYHYELASLIEDMEEGEDFYLPTEEIYVVVEKRVPLFDGETFYSVEELDTLEKRDVDLQYTKQTLGGEDDSGEDRVERLYRRLRVNTMSKVYFWTQRMLELYPNDMTLYYEDDDCMVYRIHQNPYFLLNLNVGEYEAGMSDG